MINAKFCEVYMGSGQFIGPTEIASGQFLLCFTDLTRLQNNFYDADNMESELMDHNSRVLRLVLSKIAMQLLHSFWICRQILKSVHT